MGMTRNQLALVRYVAENNIQKAKDAALCCCAEDTTQKNHYAVTKYQSLLRSGGMNLMELPANVSSFATMEDLTNTYLESRYYLTNEETDPVSECNIALWRERSREDGFFQVCSI